MARSLPISSADRSRRRYAALEQLFAPPRSMDEADVARVLETLLAYATTPDCAASAATAIRAIIEDYPGPREGVHAFIRAHGDKLPEEIRRDYLRQVPGSTLLTPLPVKYSDREVVELTAFDRQLAEWNKLWGDGIRRAVEYENDRRKVAQEYWAALKATA